MSEDIVARLRRHQCISGIRTVIDDAADEIERLRRQVCRMSDERTEMLTELRQRVETLTAERDEARREIVTLLAGTSIEPMHRFAEERGWDCFKEDGNGSR